MHRVSRQNYADQDSMLDPLVIPYKLYVKKIEVHQYHFYLSDKVIEPVHYIDMVETIRNASEADTVYIYLNTQGGNVNTGIQLVNACRESAATIHTVLDGEAGSLGALLLLVGDIITINDNGMLMFHNYSSINAGKGHEQRSKILAEGLWYVEFLKDICFPFLSEAEIDKIANGSDIWLNAVDAKERVVRLAEHRQRIHQSTLS